VSNRRGVLSMFSGIQFAVIEVIAFSSFFNSPITRRNSV